MSRKKSFKPISKAYQPKDVLGALIQVSPPFTAWLAKWSIQDPEVQATCHESLKQVSELDGINYELVVFDVEKCIYGAILPDNNFFVLSDADVDKEEFKPQVREYRESYKQMLADAEASLKEAPQEVWDRAFATAGKR